VFLLSASTAVFYKPDIVNGALLHHLPGMACVALCVYDRRKSLLVAAEWSLNIGRSEKQPLSESKLFPCGSQKNNEVLFRIVRRNRRWAFSFVCVN
jgi:hypothetical protein